MSSANLKQEPLSVSALRARLFITRKEAAELLNLDPRTLGRSIEAGECPYVRVSGVIRIPTPPFLRWAGIDLENSEAEPASSAVASSPTPTPTKAIGHSHVGSVIG
jgi:excisionase family DNA binding protein